MQYGAVGYSSLNEQATVDRVSTLILISASALARHVSTDLIDPCLRVGPTRRECIRQYSNANDIPPARYSKKHSVVSTGSLASLTLSNRPLLLTHLPRYRLDLIWQHKYPLRLRQTPTQRAGSMGG